MRSCAFSKYGLTKPRGPERCSCAEFAAYLNAPIKCNSGVALPTAYTIKSGEELRLEKGAIPGSSQIGTFIN